LIGRDIPRHFYIYSDLERSDTIHPMGIGPTFWGAFKFGRFEISRCSRKLSSSPEAAGGRNEIFFPSGDKNQILEIMLLPSAFTDALFITIAFSFSLAFFYSYTYSSRIGKEQTFFKD
jgi:hypothetical protein